MQFLKTHSTTKHLAYGFKYLITLNITMARYFERSNEM